MFEFIFTYYTLTISSLSGSDLLWIAPHSGTLTKNIGIQNGTFSRFHGASPRQAKRKGTKLHLFNPLVIKIILEGGSVMDYRIEHEESQRFLALVRPFLNESLNDDNDHSIPDFWGECSEKDLIEPIQKPQNMAKAAGATEELKAYDQMAWVGLMNSCKTRVEEIIFSELVYC